MSNKIKSIIVGSHFVPPAKIILKCLRSGAKLTLEQEPENPYDENAIKVFVEPNEVDFGALHAEEHANALSGYGTTGEEIINGPPIYLGHIAASGGKVLGKALGQISSLVGTIEIAKFAQEHGLVWPLAASLSFQGELFVVTIKGE
jgi:hypothetical protein